MEYIIITIKASLPEASLFGQLQANLNSWTITGEFEYVVSWDAAPIWTKQPSGDEYKVFCIDAERVTEKKTDEGDLVGNPYQFLLDEGYEPPVEVEI